MNGVHLPLFFKISEIDVVTAVVSCWFFIFYFPFYFFRGEENADPEAALEYLSKYCRWAVVTLGPNGCIAKYGQEVGHLQSCKVIGVFHTFRFLLFRSVVH